MRQVRQLIEMFDTIPRPVQFVIAAALREPNGLIHGPGQNLTRTPAVTDRPGIGKSRSSRE